MKPLVARLAKVVAMLLLLTVAGTVGYRRVEGWGWGDSLYMTVITLSTVGFGEAHPLSPGGRIFTVALIAAGSGVVVYLLTLTGQLILDGQLRQSYRREKMAHRIRKNSGHIIVAGYGRYGQAVVEELHKAGCSVVVLDQNPELVPRLEAQGLAYVIAAASSDEGLAEAGIAGASAIVAATPSEAENVFITLAAKELNPEIRVHARCETEAAARRLARAGADQVVSPFQMGGARTAASILRPAVVDFLEIIGPGSSVEVDLEELAVAPDSELVGTRLGEIEHRFPALRIVALRRGAQPIRIAPGRDTAVEPRDLLVIIGERPSLLDLAACAEPQEA